ncbi:DUF973 family protein [Sulfurisphaera javensis]|uniref:DUF973 family protein n=1 Tax=Sulfurisphaera javensis TaxID=2049879 RepID=A0AAT9GMN2_9CREN
MLAFAIPKLRDAFNDFLQTGKDVRNGITGANLLPWAYLILFIGGILAIISIFTLRFALGLFAGIIIAIGAILEFIAGLLIGLSIYNLGRFYQADLMWVGGILIMIPGINFIGWILTYISIDEVLRKLGAFPQQFYPPSPQPTPYQQIIQVYQVGTGTLTADGKANFTLYASMPLQIVSASIDNTTISVGGSSITPQNLNQGNNNVTIQFPPLSGFIKGNIYTVTLVLSNGQMIKVYLTFT